MTNRDKVNALSNREMAVLWDYIKSDCAGSNCVFNACPDCGGDIYVGKAVRESIQKFLHN